MNLLPHLLLFTPPNTGSASFGIIATMQNGYHNTYDYHRNSGRSNFLPTKAAEEVNVLVTGFEVRLSFTHLNSKPSVDPHAPFRTGPC